MAAISMGLGLSRSTSLTEILSRLSVFSQADSTLAISAAAGQLQIVVTAPSVFSGSYSLDPSDLAQGPINLVAPRITPSDVARDTYYAIQGLWVFDDALGQPNRSWAWTLNGVVAPGATIDRLEAKDEAGDLRTREILTQMGDLTRQSVSAAYAIS